jgi:hypothetical protein
MTMHRAISQSVPRVDRFTELGRPRTELDLDIEYHRLLSRDQNPLAFLYGGSSNSISNQEDVDFCCRLSKGLGNFSIYVPPREADNTGDSGGYRLG